MSITAATITAASISTILTILGLSAAELANMSHSQKIANAETKINELRAKNDIKSQTKLAKIDNLLNNNHELARMFPRYSKLLHKDAMKLEARKADELKRYNDATTALNNRSTINMDRANKWTFGKVADIVTDKVAKDNNKELNKISSQFNLNNFEQEV